MECCVGAFAGLFVGITVGWGLARLSGWFSVGTAEGLLVLLE